MLAKISEFLKAPCTIMGHTENNWRAWLEDVLLTLLMDGEGFSGKRPNCNSGWQDELAAGLAIIDPLVITEWSEDGDRQIPYSINWQRYNQTCKLVLNQLMFGTEFEEFNCTLDKIDGDLAYVTAKNNNGEEHWVEMPAAELTAVGVRERRRFTMMGSFGYKDIPDKELTEEDYKQIEETLALLGDPDAPQSD